MKSFRVLAASLNPDSGYIEVVKEITADDNTTSLNLHAMHPESLEWKAVEFGLSDPDEIIDGILHEPFFANDIQPMQVDVDTARTNFRSALATAKSKFANNTPKNNSLVKAQLKTAGVDQRHIDAVDNDPYQVIKGLSPFDPEVMAVKQEHVDKVRTVAANERARQAQLKQQPTLTPTQRAERLRESRRTQPVGERPVGAIAEEVTLQPIALGHKKK